MNKLIIPNGGMPLHGNDFEWIHTGIAEALKGVVSLFGATSSGSFIISGCEPSLGGGNVSITEGFACIGWEVCYCPAQTVAALAIGDVSIKLVQSYDPAGQELFADLVTRDTYAIRRGIISTGSTSPEINLASPVRLPKRIEDIVLSQEVEHEVSSFQANFSSGLPIVLKKVLNRTHIQGNVFYAGSSSNGADLYAFNIPTDFAPFTPCYFMASTIENDVYRVSIFPAGQVYIQYVGTPVDWSKGCFFNFSWLNG